MQDAKGDSIGFKPDPDDENPFTLGHLKAISWWIWQFACNSGRATDKIKALKQQTPMRAFIDPNMTKNEGRSFFHVVKEGQVNEGEVKNFSRLAFTFFKGEPTVSMEIQEFDAGALLALIH